MDHRAGNMSMAMNSVSAMPPTCFMTLSAAIMTAGSLVLIPLRRGTIFSCIVYLSKAVDELFFFPSFIIPSSPSLLALASGEPPHNMTKASRPRTLIPRLLVLLKTLAMTGNKSFLMVLKSRTGNMVGSLRRAESTIE